jgi:hypothetical protein
MTKRGADRPEVMIGLPYSSKGELLNAALECGARILISAGSCWRKGALRRPGMATWIAGASMDSAGFTAMRQGGYRWSVFEYVDMITGLGAYAPHGDCLPFPLKWWSAMDFCCEPEIAKDRAEVERRIDATITTYDETIEYLDWWRGEGDTWTPDPMPVLQGRLPSDYLRCAAGIAYNREIRGRDALPDLVGIGSVCRRHLHGPDGLISVLRALHAELPPHVRLHLFGVKGAALPELAEFEGRVESIDSMAWDFAARVKAREAGIPCTVGHRARTMKAWYAAQIAAKPRLRVRRRVKQ